MIKIFLSYARGDDEPFVRRLNDDLRASGFEVWFDRVSMPSRQLTFFQEIRDAIAARDRLLLVIGPKAITSEYVSQEWKNALEMGKCVNPIVRINGLREDGGTVDGYALIPDELTLIHAEDFRDDSRYNEHLASLIRQLSDLAPPLGKLVAVPTLPLHYLAQRDRLLNLRDALLIDLQGPVVVTGAAARVGVQGMGGIGKSVLAAALARDLEVRRAFPDGVFWVGVGQQPNLVELQRFVAKELGDEALFNDLHTGKQKLKDMLAERAALLILDDVWQSADANAFDVLGPRCKLLLTTRDAGLVSTMAGTGYQVQLPTEAEALALLANAAREPVESLPLAREIVEECGRLPLALALCGGMVQAGIAWQDLLDALREHELEFLADEHALEDQHRNLWRALEVSVRVLPEDKQRRFAELAVFQSGLKVPEAAAVVLWGYTGGLSERHARRLLVEFKQRSLVQLDRSAGAEVVTLPNVSLHDLLHDFATRLATQLFGNLAALHDQLLEAYGKHCPNGWPSGPNDGYFFQRLRDHLIEAGRGDELVSLLLDLKWLEAKAGNGLVFDLPTDFREASRVARTDHPQRRFLPLIEEALRRDIHFIARHREDYPQALFQCLWNSCWWYDCGDASHYVPSEKGQPRITIPEHMEGPRLFTLLELWHKVKLEDCLGFCWVRSLRPPRERLGGGLRAILRGHTAAVNCVCVSPDGRMLASGANEWPHEEFPIRIWDVQSGEVLMSIRNHKQSAEGVSFSPDGKWIAATGGDWKVSGSIVSVWDVHTGVELLQMRGERAGNAISAVFFPDGGRIVSGNRTFEGAVRIWNVEAGGEERCFYIHRSSGIGSYTHVAVSPDGTLAVSGSGWGGSGWSSEGEDSSVCVWDTRTGSEICRYRDVVMFQLREFPSEYPTAAITSVDFSRDGSRIISASRDGTVQIWDACGRGELLRVDLRDRFAISVEFSPDGKHFATGGSDGTLRIWNAETGEQEHCFYGHELRVTSVAFFPDGHRVASGSSDGTIRVWSLENVFPQRRLKDIEGHVERIGFSKHGGFIYCRSAQGEVTLLESSTGQLVRGVVNEPFPPPDEMDAFQFPWRAVNRPLETVIESARERKPVAWFHVALNRIRKHPAGSIWAGICHGEPYVIQPEGLWSEPVQGTKVADLALGIPTVAGEERWMDYYDDGRICRRCGTILLQPKTISGCTVCGTGFESNDDTVADCATCGIPIPWTWHYCTYCGAQNLKPGKA